MRVMVVEDSEGMSRLLGRILREDGYAVDEIANGDEALWMAEECDLDAIVLDVALPSMSGFEVCQRLRKHGDFTPVLMLTARDSIDDRVAGLDSGADDYLTKPFAVEELRARVRALIRRGPSPRPAVLACGDVELDPATKTVTKSGSLVQLTSKEFAVLEYLLRHPGEVLSRRQIIEHVWDFNFEANSNIVDVYVRYLRSKLGKHSIETVRGSGYRVPA
ncbi:MAG: two-component system response regulator TcrA [Actinomycetota bacterium]